MNTAKLYSRTILPILPHKQVTFFLRCWYYFILSFLSTMGKINSKMLCKASIRKKKPVSIISFIVAGPHLICGNSTIAHSSPRIRTSQLPLLFSHSPISKTETQLSHIYSHCSRHKWAHINMV